jgi:hypothetical protein
MGGVIHETARTARLAFGSMLTPEVRPGDLVLQLKLRSRALSRCSTRC